MQSIITKYSPATDTRGSRIIASAQRGRCSIPYPCEFSEDEAHEAAAQALVNRFVAEDMKQYGTPPAKNPWGKPRVSGVLPDGRHCHVFVS